MAGWQASHSADTGLLCGERTGRLGKCRAGNLWARWFCKSAGTVELVGKEPSDGGYCINPWDFCLPNVLVKHEQISGFIDLGKMGPADRWQDLDIVLRSLKHNFLGMFTNKKVWFDFEPQMLLDELF
ncbi:MAG: phosphotransferase [Acetatifactor sp.]